MTRLALALLGSLLLVTPAQATTFRVDAETEGSTIVRKPCTSAGPCCNSCHVGQAAAKTKTFPKHDRALYGKHVHELAEGQKLKVRGAAYVTKEKGRLVLVEGGKRTLLPASTFIVKDPGRRFGVVIEE
jgi:hypothetical protein